MKEKFKAVKKNSQIDIAIDNKKSRWRADKYDIIGKLMSICEDYFYKGYKMTLRQLYYQMVAKDWLPNFQEVYNKIGGLKDEAVYSGRIDWSVFEDRGRIPSRAGFDDDVEGALSYAARVYRLDRQLNQPNHIEVWTEKDAISSILRGVTNQYGITLAVNKGYTSSTAIYNAYCRFLVAIESGQRVVILYFGDHDPSGLDMIRDINDRLMLMFCEGERADLYSEFNELIEEWEESTEGEEFWDEHEHDEKFYKVDEDGEDGYEYFDWRRAFFAYHFKIVQIGLTMEQIEMYDPPPNPAKSKDPRSKWYREKFGDVSWEVDALSPEIMEEIVQDGIEEYLDVGVYDDVMTREGKEKAQILSAVINLNNLNNQNDENKDKE